MRAEIVSIGTELLLGTITDTNASYLAQRLAQLGIDCYYVSHVGDNLERIVETLKRGWDRSDLIVTTGGLGPTQDDLTREAVAALLGEKMEVDSAMEAELRAFFARRGVQMPQGNVKQATLIPSAETLRNPVGTAPGWWVARGGPGGRRIIVSMPGVPYEMRRMWEREAEPRLTAAGTGGTLVSRTLKVLGMGESMVADMVADLMEGSNPTLAPYAKQDGVHLRITAKAADEASAREMIAPHEARVRERLGSAIYGADEETPLGVVGRMLVEAGLSFAALEVGGTVAGSISPLAADAEGAGTKLSRGALTISALGASRVLSPGDEGSESDDLEGAAKVLAQAWEADVVLAVSGSVTSEGVGSGVVAAEIAVVALTPGENGPDLTRTRQRWKTEVAEVRRLAGLAAMNLLRLRLLELQGQGRKQ